MENQIKLLTGDQLDDYRGALRRNRCAEADFELKVEEKAPATVGIFPITGRVTVRRKSNGVEQIYPCGHGTTWPADFEHDLNRGHFEGPGVS